MKKYTSFEDAVHDSIYVPLSIGHDEDNPYTVGETWDIETIAREVIHTDGEYFWCAVDPETFWEVVEDNEL